MDKVAIFIMALEVLFFAACGVALIYLIFRRIKIKKTERFGDRDN